jgi:hypothetical protein
MNMRRALPWVFVGMALGLSCGERSGSDPFRDAGADARAGSGGEAGENGVGEAGAPPVLGGACVDDTQCNDENDCTSDFCDGRYDRCRNEPLHAVCDDGNFCNGVESCDRTLGCRAGPVVSCSDANTCTIDVCVEETRDCRHEPRDADGDGDPALSCYGKDCDDFDPLTSSASEERCGNGRDDDCDEAVDEDGCVVPAHDRCGDALSIEADGAYTLSTRGAAADFALSCAPEAAFRDLVVAIIVPDGAPKDVDIVAVAPKTVNAAGRTLRTRVALATVDRCGNAGSETACVESVDVADNGTARLLLRSLEPGTHAVYVALDRETDVTLTVHFREATEPPPNLTCGTAVPISPGTPTRALLAGLPDPPLTGCPLETGALYYSLLLEEPRDVRVHAAALDGHGAPVVSLRSARCAEPEDEITCRVSDPAELFARALPEGRYVIAVAGTGPSEVELVVSLSQASDPPPTEGCSAPPALIAGEQELVDLGAHTDAVQIGCLVGAPDASYELELRERSDVMLLHAPSASDQSAVLLVEPQCELSVDVLACETSWMFPVRAVAHDVPKGSVRAIVESRLGSPASLTAFIRPTTNGAAVLRADSCSEAVEIPETGGRFEGNTANLFADYSASCDYGGVTGAGAPDQMLHLVLPKARRVVFDMQGSNYDTLVTVRRDDGCPGKEIEGACAVGYVTGRSFLDVTLEAGEYNVQIDGYDGASGRWVLEVFTATP